MMDKHTILGVHVTDRLKDAVAVQKLLSEFGVNIRTRLGLHDSDGTNMQPAGVLILELVGSDEACQSLADKLNALEGLEVQSMVFCH
jgi:hypothetical protein